MTRRVTIQTPLGQALQFRQLRGHEGLSELYALDIDLLSTDKSIDAKALLGKSATVVVETDGGGKRYIDGLVSRFGLQGQDHSLYSYKLTLRPWLWLATLRSDFRIFQFKTVPDIIQDVLGLYGQPFKLKLSRGYRAWDYCVQYHESDFDFVARLCEHEGIYYHFQHAAGQHTLVFADDIEAGHDPLPGGAAIPFHPPEKVAVAEQECILSWQVLQDVHPGRHYNDDYDFKKPKADLSNMRQTPPGHANDKYEQYEWPGGYTEFADGETYARVRLEQQLSPRHIARATSNRRELGPGYTLTLTNHPREDQNQDYLILAVHYEFQENPQVSEGSGGSGSQQKFSLVLQPKSVIYRPQRKTPKPRTHGPQTAIVVGPAGEEIWVDQYGRVKVQFHWDREGKMDENSSCWVRVSTAWAGPKFGAVFTPRIGMEVIIDFLNGDPDYPILTGCVYNATNMPPWGLPDNATQSGWLTRSSKGGAPGAGQKNGAGDANAIRFEDKAGQEQLWLHAQKDQLTEVEHDEDKWVGNDRRKTIDGNETNVVHKNRTETVDQNETITVHQNRTETVDLDETITIHHNRSETVDLNETISIGINRTETVGANETVSIGSNRSVTIGGNKTETIALAKAETIGLAKALSIGLGYQTSVGAAMNTSVGGFQADQVGLYKNVLVAGGDYSTTVSSGSKTVTAAKTIVLTAGDGASVLTMTDDSISLSIGSSTMVLKKDGTVTVNGKDIKQVASSDITHQAGGTVKVVASNIHDN